MSATARLWRRAPLWRLSVFACVASATLAALYPSPMLLAALSRAGIRLPAAAPAASAPAVVTPPFGAVFHDRIAFAGRTLALPPGDWHEIYAVRTRAFAELNVIALARTASGALTGILIAQGSVSSPPRGAPGFAPDPQCDSPANFQSVASPPDANGAHRTCWYVRRVDLDPNEPTGAAGLQAIPDVAAAEDRLHALGVTIPPLRILSAWGSTTPDDVFRVQLYEPGPPPPGDSGLRAAADRMRRTGAAAFRRDDRDDARPAPAAPAAPPARTDRRADRPA